MAGHFTYYNHLDSSELKQGDVLKNTGELADLIKKVHPHYSGEEYKYFQVLTQSCDLARRGSKKECSSRYITLAAVRNLDTVIARAIEKEAEPNKRFTLESTLYCSEKHKPRIASVVESLFNNNDKNHFFLKSCPEAGLEDDSCTFLHLSIAIRAYEHFDKCLEAKILELNYGFQAKLGWLVGNLYSRVGTKDFVPGHFETQKEFIEFINDVMDQQVAWIPAKSFSEIRKLANERDTKKNINDILDEAEEKQKQDIKQRIDVLAEKIRKEVNLDKKDKAKIIDVIRRARVVNL